MRGDSSYDSGKSGGRRRQEQSRPGSGAEDERQRGDTRGDEGIDLGGTLPAPA
jgi:hypothetical protein